MYQEFRTLVEELKRVIAQRAEQEAAQAAEQEKEKENA